MERTIDRTSYRRNSRDESNVTKKEVKVNEMQFNYTKIFLNQIIVSLLIIITILTAKYFEVNIIYEWISENMSEGYGVCEIFNLVKNKLNSNNNNMNLINISGDVNLSGDTSDSGDDYNSGESGFITAVEGVNQMQEDAKYVKENYEFVLPVKGTVTSEFGCRDSNNEIVSTYHTGLDIGANTGTPIYAAHDGVVTKAENFSSFGKCIIIENGDLSTIYAHCSSININKGMKVNKGDFIGKIGMTGNATGPHLHLEVKYQGRYINPREVLGEI